VPCPFVPLPLSSYLITRSPTLLPPSSLLFSFSLSLSLPLSLPLSLSLSLPLSHTHSLSLSLSLSPLCRVSGGSNDGPLNVQCSRRWRTHVNPEVLRASFSRFYSPAYFTLCLCLVLCTTLCFSLHLEGLRAIFFLSFVFIPLSRTFSLSLSFSLLFFSHILPPSLATPSLSL
jgi:hypothetical protein